MGSNALRGRIAAMRKFAWPFQREKVQLGGFIRLLCGYVIDAKSIDTSVLERSFNQSERERLSADLDTFRFVVLALLFFDEVRKGKLAITMKELGRLTGHAMVLAYKDKGWPDSDATEKSQRFWKALEEYLSALEGRSEEEISEKGIFFFVCEHFATRAVADLRAEAQRLRHFDAFDTAKQVYRSVKKFFNAAYRKVSVEVEPIK